MDNFCYFQWNANVSKILWITVEQLSSAANQNLFLERSKYLKICQIFINYNTERLISVEVQNEWEYLWNLIMLAMLLIGWAFFFTKKIGKSVFVGELSIAY